MVDDIGVNEIEPDADDNANLSPETRKDREGGGDVTKAERLPVGPYGPEKQVFN